MHSFDPLQPRGFDLLIGRSDAARRMHKLRGDLVLLITPTPKQVADGLWRRQVLLAADAFNEIATYDLIDAGASHRAVRFARRDIQAAIIAALPDLDDGGDVVLGLAHDGRHYIVTSAANTFEVAHLIGAHFTARGITDAAKLAVAATSLRGSYRTLRERARKHKINLPARLWPTLAEFDAYTEAVAGALGPRCAPVIMRWREARAAESESAARRGAGKLS